MSAYPNPKKTALNLRGYCTVIRTYTGSSHLLSDVEDVCDRVVIYYGGRIQAQGTLNELLAKPDSLRITTPVLPRETLEKVLAIIRKDITTGEVRVDNPTQNLESYFLDVVAKAKLSAHETSGAQSGARVAEYLRGGVEAKPESEMVLEKLSLPQAAPPPAQPASAPEAKPVDLSKADEKLSALLGGKK